MNTKHLTRIVGGGVSLGVLAASLNALAVTADSTFTVSASVAASCTITTTGLAFGAYDPVNVNLTAPKDGTSTVSVNCTQGSIGTISMEQGANFDATNVRRQMAVGTERIYYHIYNESTRTTEWKWAGSLAANLVTTTGSGAVQTYTAYGRIPGGQTGANAGSYTDSVIARVTF